MNRLIISILILTATVTQAQVLSIINDPDGFTNIRNGKGTDHKIIGRINEGQIFYSGGSSEDEWYAVYVFNKDEYLDGFVHRSRIIELEKLPQIGTKKAITNGRQITGDQIDFKITLKDFVKSQHKYDLENDKWIIKIDGLKPNGVDGGYPNKEIDNIVLEIDNQLIPIPIDQYLDVYELDLTSLKIHKSDNGYIFISSSNSDGAGYYDLVWIIKDKEYIGRFIGVI